jgi:hypothetical protein
MSIELPGAGHSYFFVKFFEAMQVSVRYDTLQTFGTPQQTYRNSIPSGDGVIDGFLMQVG